jgi:hypothetical protein
VNGAFNFPGLAVAHVNDVLAGCNGDRLGFDRHAVDGHSYLPASLEGEAQRLVGLHMTAPQHRERFGRLAAETEIETLVVVEVDGELGVDEGQLLIDAGGARQVIVQRPARRWRQLIVRIVGGQPT